MLKIELQRPDREEMDVAITIDPEDPLVEIDDHAGDRALLFKTSLGALLDRLDPATCAELGIPRAAPAGETTSPEVATVAARGLATGALTPEEIRTVCGSCLTQAGGGGAGEAERLLAALGAADASLAPQEAGYLVMDDDGKRQGRGNGPLAALRAAFPEVGR